MSESVKIIIPPSVAAFIKPDLPLEERLRAAGGITSLPPREEIMLLFCLGKDSAPEVSELAQVSFSGLSTERLSSIEGWDAVHPAVLHSIAVVHASKDSIRGLLLAHPSLSDATRTLLLSMQVEQELFEEQAISPSCELSLLPVAAEVCPDDKESHSPEYEDCEIASDIPADEDEEEDEEQFRSKYQIAQVMGIGEKIKMALTGDKEWRKILVKDSNKLVSSGVLKNPRISEGEVLTILKAGSLNDEIMRIICANKEWVKNYPIRKALVENSKTPLANALRFLGTLNEKDIANYAKSRNISSVIATQAKRMLLNKKR